MNPKGHTPVDLETADPASSRRSLIGAVGAAGAALAVGALVASRPAAAGTFTPNEGDRDRLNVMMRFELTARDLYLASADTGLDDVAAEFAATLATNHGAYAQAIAGIAGLSAELRSSTLFDRFAADFTSGDDATWATAGHELETTFVATHTEAIGQFEAIEPINLVASIIAVEARQAMVLADIAELGTGNDVLNAPDAKPLELALSEADTEAEGGA
jgi:Ferritin-like domain